MAGQLEASKSKADKWAERISTGRIPRKLAWTGLSTHMWPSLRYPLATTTFSEEEGKLVMKELYKALLPKLGIC